MRPLLETPFGKLAVQLSYDHVSFAYNGVNPKAAIDRQLRLINNAKEFRFYAARLAGTEDSPEPIGTILRQWGPNAEVFTVNRVEYVQLEGTFLFHPGERQIYGLTANAKAAPPHNSLSEYHKDLTSKARIVIKEELHEYLLPYMAMYADDLRAEAGADALHRAKAARDAAEELANAWDDAIDNFGRE